MSMLTSFDLLGCRTVELSNYLPHEWHRAGSSPIDLCIQGYQSKLALLIRPMNPVLTLVDHDSSTEVNYG